MNDIVERLKDISPGVAHQHPMHVVDLAQEGVREITHLREANKELTETLDGICKAYKALCEMTDKEYHKGPSCRYANAKGVIAKHKGDVK